MNKTALAVAAATILTLPTSVALAEVTEEVTPTTPTEVVDPSAPVTQEVPGEVILPTEPEVKPEPETPVTPVVPVSPDTPVEIEQPQQPSENTDSNNSSNEQTENPGASENSTGIDTNQIPETSGETMSRPTQSNQSSSSNGVINSVTITPNTSTEFEQQVDASEPKTTNRYLSTESKYSSSVKVREKETADKSNSDQQREELPSTGTASSVMGLIGTALAPISSILLKKKK
ncbi:LPXTG cell wall anchor domain-containing protein [Streptococcus danieliae]|uniref:LPXTG cell wall anchor domain-containing protein n=1 Tax=Streptococcus danieliae TaxID=747656 RepID=UPI0021C6B076|nr:LPXTG cell wall anchor domain-containing protein [Streptococcus danieliae]MCU0081764.1 LPXTG cell wall anchor domain-containing protein [Streptococcus danieliae]